MPDVPRLRLSRAFQDREDNALNWMGHFDFSAEEVAPLLGDNDRRIRCAINGSPDFPCALMHDGRGGYFINISKALRKAHGLRVGQAAELELWPDHSTYGTDMPEELGELLAQDEQGSRYFHALSPGKQRTLIYVVAKIKSPNKRLEKAVVILDHLVRRQGDLDYKVLNEDFKQASRF